MIVPEVVTGLPDTENPEGTAISTLVTVPVPVVTVPQLVFVPSVVRYLPLFDVWLGTSALNPAFAVVCPVPPFTIPTVSRKLLVNVPVVILLVSSDGMRDV